MFSYDFGTIIKYCVRSFQKQSKRCGTTGPRGWSKCYNYEPHEHPQRLKNSLPRTGYMEFIFACASGDVAFCPTKYLERIVARIKDEPSKSFLIQSKDPATFNRVKLPKNVVLGTTIETNRDEWCRAEKISKAPLPSKRIQEFKEVEHACKILTFEPLYPFDLDIMIDWADQIQPRMVWLGVESTKSDLPNPEMDAVKRLHWGLSRKGITVLLKKTLLDQN